MKTTKKKDNIAAIKYEIKVGLRKNMEYIY